MSDDLLSKLNRIDGQVQGIKKMYEGDRTCLEVVQQIVAVRSALAAVGRDLLKGEATRCTREQNSEYFDKLLKTLFDLT